MTTVLDWTIYVIAWIVFGALSVSPSWILGWIVLRSQRRTFVKAMRGFNAEPEPRARWERIVFPFRDPKKEKAT